MVTGVLHGGTRWLQDEIVFLALLKRIGYSVRPMTQLIKIEWGEEVEYSVCAYRH